MERFVTGETTNALIKCNHIMRWERLDCLIIPHQHNGKQIDHIDPIASIIWRQLEKILLPRALHIIEEETFLNCKNLKSIWAQVGLNTISHHSFNGCESLKETHFRILKDIRDRAFAGCASLKTQDLGYQIKQLGNDLLNGCHSLESLTLEGTGNL